MLCRASLGIRTLRLSLPQVSLVTCFPSMTDRKRRSWAMKMLGRSKDPRGGAKSPPSLVSPKQSADLTLVSPTYSSSPPSLASTNDDAPVSRPSTPKRWSLSLSPSFSPTPKSYPQDVDQQSIPERPSVQNRPSSSRGSFSKMSFSSMMGGLSSLSLSRTTTKECSTDKSNGDDDKKEKESRGRSLLRGIRTKSASQAPGDKDDASSRSRSRARSQSPFFFRRSRNSESSPIPQPVPLAHSDADLSDSSAVHPRSTSFADDPESETDVETEDEDKTDGLSFDTVTERNTEQNAQIISDVQGVDVEEPDPLGEGVNVVVPHEPYFPSSLNPREGSARGKRGAKRRKSLKHEPLPLHTARPRFERDRCTTTITQGDPESGRSGRRYMVASDLGEESRYALEWGIGTVLHDGDELLVVHIIENDSKGAPILTCSKTTLTYSKWTHPSQTLPIVR